MNPINLLPQRERLWQRQRRWWRERWTWTLGISLAVWAGLAALLAWHHQKWEDAHASLKAQVEAQAPLLAQRERLLQTQRQWQDSLQSTARNAAGLSEPWHSWQALARMAGPQVLWERMLWDGQSMSASGHVLQASEATQLQAQWQQRWGAEAVVQPMALTTEPTMDPQGMADQWWRWEWRWRIPSQVDKPPGANASRGAAAQAQPVQPSGTEGARP